MPRETKSVALLKRVIREAVHRWVDEDGLLPGVTAPREELRTLIAALGPTEKADADYVASETGEIMLTHGKEARTSRLHPAHAEWQEQRWAEQEAEEEAELAALDAEEAEEFDRVRREFDAAVEEYADGFSSSEVSDLGAAEDSPESFFADHPEWKRGVPELDMSRADVESAVRDAVVAAIQRFD